MDIINPTPMRLHGIRREPNEFDSSFGELGLVFCERGELRRAYGCVVFGVREEDCPLGSDPGVEV